MKVFPDWKYAFPNQCMSTFFIRNLETVDIGRGCRDGGDMGTEIGNAVKIRLLPMKDAKRWPQNL